MNMIYLIVGLDRRTLAPWHRNIREDDVAGAPRAPRSSAPAPTTFP
jgi:hypothetical protein